MFKIMARYHNTGLTEQVDSAFDQRQAEYLANEYSIAYGTSWSVWVAGDGDGEDDSEDSED